MLDYNCSAMKNFKRTLVWRFFRFIVFRLFGRDGGLGLFNLYIATVQQARFLLSYG